MQDIINNNISYLVLNFVVGKSKIIFIFSKKLRIARLVEFTCTVRTETSFSVVKFVWLKQEQRTILATQDASVLMAR